MHFKNPTCIINEVIRHVQMQMHVHEILILLVGKQSTSKKLLRWVLLLCWVYFIINILAIIFEPLSVVDGLMY